MHDFSEIIDAEQEHNDELRSISLSITDPEYHLHQIPLANNHLNSNNNKALRSIKSGNASYQKVLRSKKTVSLRRVADDRSIACGGVLSSRQRLNYLSNRRVGSILILGLVYFILTTFLHKDDALDEYLRKVKEENEAIARRETLVQQTKYSVDRFKRMQQILQPISDSDGYSYQVFMHVDTPQFKALNWISNLDLMRIEITNNNKQHLVQRYVLAVLYYSTGGESDWARQMNWLSSSHECDWNDDGGIRECDDEKRVVDIALFNNLTGTIPHEISHLDQLKKLYMSRNSLTGTIPTSMKQMQELTYISLNDNKLVGTVPLELGMLPKLKYLYLHKNDLGGTVNSDHPICKDLRRTNQLLAMTLDCRGIHRVVFAEIICEEGCCTKCYRF
eukprot:CAMPEP_0194407090 /NCGR_PEP_ID=MMETSP0176-20130528/5134_1 /TAXON_ID=216777 /ORGANISM="Proboscia alata, Strain PI-D3" /LENGTH=389 /DNA_ID=CAMNT_0039206525 /DNA_START=118 /DNA_END=1287 /DNA_ORIENTATION=-